MLFLLVCGLFGLLFGLLWVIGVGAVVLAFGFST